jgi:hypothetical protein
MVVMVGSVASLVFILGMLVWAAWNTIRERVRLDCPVRRRRATLLFRLAPSGRRLDVLRCSVFGARPITCGKVCLATRSQVRE